MLDNVQLQREKDRWQGAYLVYNKILQAYSCH